MEMFCTGRLKGSSIIPFKIVQYWTVILRRRYIILKHVQNGPTQEVEMYSRNVSFKLKPKSTEEFTRILEGEIIPLLRRQRGFEDQISFIAPERNEAVDISLWDKKEDAEAYHRGKYPEVLKALARVVEGTPIVEIFQVSNSTSHQIAASAVG
jgi:hypothetical protein